MEIVPFFIENRCYFGNHKTYNEYNPERPTVIYYKWNIIGLILKKLGMAIKIHCEKDSKKFDLYLAKKSFIKWVVFYREGIKLEMKDYNDEDIIKIDTQKAEKFIQSVIKLNKIYYLDKDQK